MSNTTDAHDPSGRFAATSPSRSLREGEKRYC